MKKLTGKQRAAALAKLKRQIEHHCKQIGKHRDSLRELIDGVEDVVNRTDEGLAEIESGISRISEYV